MSLYFTAFDLYEVAVPCHPLFIEASTPATWPGQPVIIVRGTLSSGQTALGEFDRSITRQQAEETLAIFKGRDILSAPPATLWLHDLPPAPLPDTFSRRCWDLPAFSTLECLTLDALGKQWGVPLHFLLGGAVRQKVAVDFWCNQPSPNSVRSLISEAKQHCVSGIKMKSGLERNAIEAARIIAQEMGPDFRMTIDPMCSWRSPMESAPLWEDLRSIPARIQVEDPFPHHYPEAWQAIIAKGGPPLIWHARTRETALAGFHLRGISGYNYGASGSQFCHLAAQAESKGIPCWAGSSIELGILQHCRLHSAAAAAACTLASDLCSEWVREHTLITPRMKYQNGAAILPHRPGLGVELDLLAVNRFCRRHWQISL